MKWLDDRLIGESLEGSIEVLEELRKTMNNLSEQLVSWLRFEPRTF
jgi:hypothetical protein